MSSTAVITQGPTPEEDHGLDAIVRHNATARTEQLPSDQGDIKGLGIYHDGYAQYQGDTAYVHNPPTPRSNTASDGMRTRSGRSTRARTDSPFSTGNRVSKSPASRSKKSKKSKVDKSKTPKLTAPLSVLTKDLSAPLKDMDEWVNRSAETRRKEVEKRNGYVTRPMNSFMLYRSAYAERTKQWCTQNNHQVVSSVSGESWPMEPQEVRDQFNEWAKIERDNHQKAHPEYKFSPAKTTSKRRKGDDSDDDAELSDVDERNPDGEYRGGRSLRQKREAAQEAVPLNDTYGFTSNPYYGRQAPAYEQSQYQYANPGRPLPSNVAYDHNGLPYNPQTGTYVQQQTYQHPSYTYVQDVVGMRVPTPNSLNGAPQQQSIGGYGLPSAGQQMSPEELFSGSRTGTPSQQYTTEAGYGQPIYPQYTTSAAYHHPTPQQQQMYAEHQRYLQAASQPVTAIDPSLEAEMARGLGVADGENHFSDAMGDMAGAGELNGLQDFYGDSAGLQHDGFGTELAEWTQMH